MQQFVHGFNPTKIIFVLYNRQNHQTAAYLVLKYLSSEFEEDA